MFWVALPTYRIEAGKLEWGASLCFRVLPGWHGIETRRALAVAMMRLWFAVRSGRLRGINNRHVFLVFLDKGARGRMIDSAREGSKYLPYDKRCLI